MEPKKKTSFKCGDVLHKGSSFLSFISLLLIVGLFLRMESINSKTEMNELRISNMESRIKIESLPTTVHNNEMEMPESKYKVFFDCQFYYLRYSSGGAIKVTLNLYSKLIVLKNAI